MSKTIIRRPVTDINWAQADLHPLLTQLYAARGITDLSELEHGLENLLPHDALLGIDNAVACLHEMIIADAPMVVIGDFDVDGATSSALAVSALNLFGAKQVSYLVPNRFTYGYGLTPEIVDVAAINKPALIITVDNGISSIAGVERANELGIRVLITDHHLPGSVLPNAYAIVNPNQPGDLFPSKNLAGVGVIFYVMLSLRSHLRKIGFFAQRNIAEPNMAQFLDLVALGTVADVVALDKNNRILVHQGLNRIRAGKTHAGIQALLDVSGRASKRISASDLGFAIGPRLNAAGRLDDMSLGIACLLSQDPSQARDMAVELDRLNKERQGIEADMQNQAVSELSKLKISDQLSIGLCLYDERWHQGVIGILASRIKDKLNRPVIAFARVSEYEIKGSARSVKGVHIRDVLDTIASHHPELISKFGGHAMAAGLSLHISRYDAFCQAFDKEVRKHLSEHDLQNQILSDGELQSEYFNLKMAEMLRNAGPWGQAFPEPLFDNVFQVIDQKLIGKKHLKMILTPQNSKQMLDAILFNIDSNKWPNHRCQHVRAVYRLDINEYRGQTHLQLLVEHLEEVS